MSQRLWLGLFIAALLIAPLAVRTSWGESPSSKQPAAEEPAETEAPETPPAEASEGEPPAEGEQTTEAPADETEAPAPAAEATEDLAALAPAAQANFDEVFARWRAHLVQMATLREEYFAAADSELPGLQEQFAGMIDQGFVLLEELRTAGIEAYRTAPNENRQISSFLYQLLIDDMEHSRYEQAAPLAQLLIDHQYDNKSIYGIAGISYFVLHDYDKAQQYLTQAQAIGQLGPSGQMYLGKVEEARELWAAEQAIRLAEAEADDLPRVKIETTEGDIVVELFEEQAPQTVGNFVSLVEKGAYDGTPFHRVLSDFMAQGGDSNGDGSGSPGYNIYDEHNIDGARTHFRGSLSMANTGQPNSGGAQFFICFRPTYELNGKHTVFGRVIEGMDVLGRIQRIDPDNPDDQGIEPTQILHAEVLRKRGHEYVPSPVE